MTTRKGKVYSLILIIALLLISITLFYFLLIIPLHNKVLSNSSRFKEESESILSGPTANSDELKTDLLVSQTRNLQIRLPVSPSVENFLLELEKAEVASGILMKSIVSVNDQDTLNDGQGGSNSSIINNMEGTVSGSQQNSQNNITQNNQTQSINSKDGWLPKGVERKLFNVEIESKSYEEFYLFIEKIDSLQRITSIDSIQFKQDQNIISNELVTKPLSFQISLSIFYYPTLQNLLKSAEPKISKPMPSNKTNPFESLPSSK